MGKPGAYIEDTSGIRPDEQDRAMAARLAAKTEKPQRAGKAAAKEGGDKNVSED